MKTHFKIPIIAGLISIIVLIIITPFYSLFSLPPRNGILKVKGLINKVNVYYDNYGRAHVFAKNLHDLLFTQGYLTAQDRLFQMDLTRRAAKGELSEIISKSGLTRDKFVRDLGVIQSAEEELKNSNHQTLTVLKYYSDGITAYINKNKHRLPIEFKVLNYRPKPWQPVDSILVTKLTAEIIDTSWQLDLIRYEIYERIPPEKAHSLFEQSFPGNPIINYNAKKYLVFDKYILKKPNLIQRWQGIREKSVALKKMLSPAYFKIKRKIIEAADFLRNGSDRWEGFNWGSNCWVVGRSKNKTPILANDPHMELATPCFWYPIHLISKKDKINVLGLSIPGIPGILIGHNGKIAWGITSLSSDVQDVFIGELKDKESLLYKWGNKWEKIKVVTSKINVKNQKPVVHKSLFTSCGPILDRNENKGLVLKWSSVEPTDHNAVESIWKLTKAANWKDFRDALRKYNGPTLSFHYADINGNIGYQAAGVIPNRSSGEGSLPYLGFDCNKHWHGYIPFDKLPNAYNPKVGYIVSANNKVVSSDYKYNLGNNFLSPFRAGRISTLLAYEKNMDLKKNQEIQKDLYSWVANYLTVQILEAYYNSEIINKELLEAVQLLNKWDFNLRADSPQTFIFEKTYENLLKKILTDKLGESLTKDYLKEWRANSLALMRILIDEDKYWLPKGIKNYPALILLSLSDAIKEIKEITKTDDPKKWEWGKYHTLTFEHLFSKAFPLLSPFTNAGPIKVGGDRDTICTFGTNNNLKVVWGPSARVVIDMKDLNNAYLQLPLGVSSQIGSPYYRDETKGWVKNTGEPFVYDEALIKNKFNDILVIKPVK